MPKFFLRGKKLKKITKSKLQPQSLASLESPTVATVATQSEPLPLTFHLDGLLNSESPRAAGGGSGGLEEVDGAVCHTLFFPEDDSGRRLPGQSPPSAPHGHTLEPTKAHPSGQLPLSPHHKPCSRLHWNWGEGEEEGGLECYSSSWLGGRGDRSPSESSQSWRGAVHHLAPPLIPSSPLTLSPSPTPSLTYLYPPPGPTSQVRGVGNTARDKLSPQQWQSTPQQPQQTGTPASYKSPKFSGKQPVSSARCRHDTTRHIQTPPTNNCSLEGFSGRRSSASNTVQQITPPYPQSSRVPKATGVSGSAAEAWSSTLAELGAVLAQRKEGEGREREPREEVGVGRDVEDEEDEEMRQCREALAALQEREARLMAEVAELRATSAGRGEAGSGAEPTLPATQSPPPEVVVAELQETLRQTEEAVQAVQGERDELKEGVGRMRDELLSLRKSNSLLATQKQQWMEVASQVRAVLEENNSLLSRHKSQQRLVSELQAQLRRRESTAEGELVQLEREKKGKELQLQQVMDGHAHLANQVSRLVGVAVGGANSTEHPDTLQRMAGLLERYHSKSSAAAAAQQDRVVGLERENKSLAVRVADAKAVIRRLEGEMGGVRDVVCEGEEAVARLRGKLEEIQERDETSQVQLAHAIAQVDKALAERDAYARIARQWQSAHSTGWKGREQGHTAGHSRALDEAQHQLQQQAREHRAQRRRYKMEIHRLRAVLARARESLPGNQQPDKRGAA